MHIVLDYAPAQARSSHQPSFLENTHADIMHLSYSRNRTLDGCISVQGLVDEVIMYYSDLRPLSRNIHIVGL